MPSGTNSRGPVARASRHALAASAETSSSPPIGDPPEGLRLAGFELWVTVADSAPWLTALDRPTLEALARLEDDAAIYRVALDRDGPIQREPVVTTKGQVVGERLVDHPASKALRRIEASASVLRKQLSIPVVDRTRLGLSVLSLRKKAAEKEAVRVSDTMRDYLAVARQAASK
jgi:hypothetical protein